jgi:L,D-peptidoglycan transpeptidase YkuD (ErfK/YbiS/YcfS/YnhG family)
MANEIANTGNASQLITVEVSEYGSTAATVTAWQRNGACWSMALGPYSGAVGFNGISTNKHEGDGTTPAGLYGFEATIYGNAPNPGVSYPYHQLVCGDWWDEDSSSSTYNMFENVACGSSPAFNDGSSEALWTETAPYPSFAVINYNPSNTPGLGSAIFLHAYTGSPTSGCVSIPLADLDQVLDWMYPSSSPAIDIGTAATITSY